MPLSATFSSAAKFKAAALTAAALMLSALPSLAQTPTPSPAPSIELRYVGGPVWRTAGQPLNLRLSVRNSSETPLEGFRLILGVSDRILTRSDLESSFVAEPGITASALPFAFDQTVPAFGTTRVTIDEPASSFATLARAVDGGVFPATVALQDPTTLQVLSAVQVPLIYYPEAPESRLNIVPLLLINDRPNRLPDGRFDEGRDGAAPLALAVREGGWLEGLLDSLEVATTAEEPSEPNKKGKRKKQAQPIPELQISVSIGPRMVEELADVADGYTSASGDSIAADSSDPRFAAEALGRLSRLLDRPEIQTVLTPYSFPDIPTMVEELPTEVVLRQLSGARAVLKEHLGAAASRTWLFPPAGRLDQPSLERLQLIQDVASEVFVSADSLVQGSPEGPEGCPELSQSFTCPITVTTPQGTTTGFRADPGLSARLSALQLAGDDRLNLQRFFAETSMIREEAPGVENRVVQATIPSLWHPRPELSRLLLKTLREAPWLKSQRADQAFEGTEAVEQEMIERAPDLAAEPDATFFAAFEETSGIVESFASFAPEASARLQRMRANLLVSQSRTLWRDPARTISYISETREESENEMAKVKIEGTDDFTCTSRDCRLQLLLTNDASYPARVSVEFISPGVRLDPTEIEDVFEPGGHPLTVKAETNTSGISRLGVRLVTVDGDYLIQEKEIVIRSTNFNRIALVITLGALGFLILFSVARSIRRRSRSKNAEA